MVKLKALAAKVNRRKTTPVNSDEAMANQWRDFDGKPIDSQHLLISMMLPSAVKEFIRELEAEVDQICGARYDRQKTAQRWGCQEGSITLANQKVRINKPRIRDSESNEEIELPTYTRFQNGELFDEKVFVDGIKKVSQRDFDDGLPKIAASFGFSKSSVSRRWIQGTEKRLKELNERDLSKLDLIAVFIDGKKFRNHGVVVALGISRSGKKWVLGIYECNTENSEACIELLRGLEHRGLPERELLFVVDGGSGLNKALEIRYDVHLPEKRRAVRIRCFFHKWCNIEKNLNEEHHREAAILFWAIRDAETMTVALDCSKALEEFLRSANRSALDSYLEAKDDLMMLHRLNLTPRLKQFFSTTNPVESLNYLTEEDLRRVKNWRDSEHFQRWIASSLLANEKRMKKVMGFRAMPALQAALEKICFHEDDKLDNEALLA